jgi:hypothetical protein
MTDAIARTRWSTLMFTGDGENIFAGSDNSGAHDVSVWDVAARGQYVKSIENGKEPLVDLDVRLNPLPFDTPNSFIVASSSFGMAQRVWSWQYLYLGECSKDEMVCFRG